MSKRDIENVGDIWEVSDGNDTCRDNRNCAVLYATTPGEVSYGMCGRSTSFCDALIQALSCSGAETAGLFDVKGRRIWG